jgi:hypothetical protein
MADRRVAFRQRDLTAAVRGVEKAGHKVARIEIGPDGRIVVIIANDDQDAAATGSEWDQDPASAPAIHQGIS